MKLLVWLRGYRFCAAYLLFFALPVRGDALTLRAIFDVLFPSTSFKKVLIYTMQLHGMVDALHSPYNKKDIDHLNTVMQASLGQLERLIENLHGEKIKCRTQDLEFLLAVLEKVAVKYQELGSIINQSDHAACMQKFAGLYHAIDTMF